MLHLASSSPTRAKILKEYGINFTQIAMEYKENDISLSLPPKKYVYNVVLGKQKQFYNLYKKENYDSVLFADSVVVVDNKIFGKAYSEKEAYEMLSKQSNNEVSVITGMIFDSKKFSLISLSNTTYKFKQFDEEDMNNYIKSKEYKGKAGAMMIEGFNKKYIISQRGNKSTAMGLNIEILKAYIW